MDFKNQENNPEENAEPTLPTELDAGFVDNYDDEKGFMFNQDIIEEKETPLTDNKEAEKTETKKEEKSAELTTNPKSNALTIEARRKKARQLRLKKEKKRRIIIISIIALLSIISIILIIRLMVINN